MPRFEPFRGIRYSTDNVSLSDVLAPPYDVVDEEERVRLEARSPYNAVHLELPRDIDSAGDRYMRAGRRFSEWLSRGTLRRERSRCFYAYKMEYVDSQDRQRETLGVLGALELSVPGEGEVLPHERTMPKPKDDRLNLLRACNANLSPVWALSLAPGLSALCEVDGPPLGEATDDEGVRHSLWLIDDEERTARIQASVAADPAVIADGHHRYETALAFREEVRASSGDRPGGHDWIMTYMVELAEKQLDVRPIHRILYGMQQGADVLALLDRFFDVRPSAEKGPGLAREMSRHGALGLITPEATWLLHPRAGAFSGDAAAARATDSRLLDAALDGVGPVEFRYHHDPAAIEAAVRSGEGQAGVLLRPATVAQIAAAAHARARMPEKTTFFHPKPRTGLVFRTLDG